MNSNEHPKPQQIMFLDLENNSVHGGVLLENGDVICGCCGGILESSDEGVTWERIEIFDTWVGLDDEICGDALSEKKGEGA